MPSTRLTVNRWSRNYTKAWLKKDAKAIAALFTEDAVYSSNPFRPVTHGRKSILDYTLGALDVGQVYEVRFGKPVVERSEEHTSELQSRSDLVCRLLLEKK